MNFFLQWVFVRSNFSENVFFGVEAMCEVVFYGLIVHFHEIFIDFLELVFLNFGFEVCVVIVKNDFAELGDSDVAFGDFTVEFDALWVELDEGDGVGGLLELFDD